MPCVIGTAKRDYPKTPLSVDETARVSQSSFCPDGCPALRTSTWIGGRNQRDENTRQCRARCGHHRTHNVGVSDRGCPHPQAEFSESLSFVLDGRHIEALEVTGMHGNRIHKFDVPLGNLQVNSTATIVGQADRAPATEYDLSMYLRPSRSAEADKF
jgi:hypothetical protein